MPTQSQSAALVAQTHLSEASSYTFPSGQLVHWATVLLHVLHEPVFHSPVVLSHVTLRVCVPHLLQSWLALGFVPVHSQASLTLHAPQSLHTPVVVLHVRLCVPLFKHPHACVELPEQLFISGSTGVTVPAQLSGEGSYVNPVQLG
ncbi:MAG: hypothetical protein ACI37O_05900 [Candidatus Avelusimicrobium sp.]|uniref:hypothetical protein n=1 Tax=Candidatus Avelusimicrobium sp. TaxID=3048833 RepID=UPI003EFE9F98